MTLGAAIFFFHAFQNASVWNRKDALEWAKSSFGAFRFEHSCHAAVVAVVQGMVNNKP